MKKFVIAGQKYSMSYYVESFGDTIHAAIYLDRNTAITGEFFHKDNALSWVSSELQKLVGEECYGR